MRGIVIGVVLITGYVAFVGALLGWMRGRLRRRAQIAADALAAAGARVGAVEMTSGKGGMVAGVSFAMDGVDARYTVRQWSRDFIVQSVLLPHAPLPAVLVRAERGVDRFGKWLGLNREAQVGDADFDAAAYVETSASDEVVRSLFADARLRDAVRALLGMGYRVELSSAGLAAMRVRSFYADFDAPEVPSVLRALVAARAVVPAMDPALAGVSKRWVPWGALALLIGGYAAMGVIGARVEGRPLWDPSQAGHAAIAGAGLWGLFLVAVVLALRGRSDGFRRTLVYGFVGVLVVPFLGALGALALNTSLDGGAEEARVAVVARVGRGRHVTLRTDVGRVSVPVAPELAGALRPGSRVRVRCRPGALGWPWIASVEPVVQGDGE